MIKASFILLILEILSDFLMDPPRTWRMTHSSRRALWLCVGGRHFVRKDPGPAIGGSEIMRKFSKQLMVLLFESTKK